MGKMAMVFLVGTLMLAGCTTTNTVTIENDAQTTVTFVFRAEAYPIAPGKTLSVESETHIPNGTYDYSTMVTLPAAATTLEDGGGLSGSLSFAGDRTEYYILYGSVLDAEGSSYKVSAVVSMNERIDNPMISSPENTSEE
jgi:hypothetical protein